MKVKDSLPQGHLVPVEVLGSSMLWRPCSLQFMEAASVSVRGCSVKPGGIELRAVNGSLLQMRSSESHR